MDSSHLTRRTVVDIMPLMSRSGYHSKDLNRILSYQLSVSGHETARLLTQVDDLSYSISEYLEVSRSVVSVTTVENLRPFLQAQYLE